MSILNDFPGEGYKLCRKGLHQYNADLKRCPECHRECRRQWYERNAEQRKERNRQWYKQNTERHKENNRQWRKQNAEQQKEYKRQWREQNAERQKEKDHQWYKQNTERHKENNRRWREQNPERQKKNDRRWRERNPEKVNAFGAKRRAAKKQAIAAWADLDAIKQIYFKAAELTKSTGIPHQVDHIYPLQSDYMCGLHVEINLQIITKADNVTKSNRTWPGQLDCQKGSVYDRFDKELTDLLNDQEN